MSQRGEHGAIVDLHIQMHYEIALFRCVSKALCEFTRGGFLLPEDLEYLGVVRWGSCRLLADELSAQVDADLNGNLKPAFGRGALLLVSEVCVLPADAPRRDARSAPRASVFGLQLDWRRPKRPSLIRRRTPRPNSARNGAVSR